MNAVAGPQLEALATEGQVSLGLELQGGRTDANDWTALAQVDLELDDAIGVGNS